MNAQDRALSEIFDHSEDPVEDFHILSQPSISVPLPMDVPRPPNLSQLPAHILHSGTVETLIGQNEDLMARLKVNIRRNSMLEQQIMEQERMHSLFKQEHNSMLAQFQILEEKTKLIREKSQGHDEVTDALRDQIDFMEAKVEAAEERSAELHAGLKFEKAYRRRIRSWVRPFVDQMKAKLDDALTRVTFLDRQLSTREAVIGDLRERYEQATLKLQNIQVSTNADQARLVESYEAKIRALEMESLKARNEATLLRDKANRLDESIATSAAAENRIIMLERRYFDRTAELGDIQGQLNSFRIEAKRLAAETLSAQADRDRARSDATEAISELQRVKDQMESLQAVWAESQKRFEASQMQQDALNRLNQELSRQINKSRRGDVVSPAGASSANRGAANSSAKPPARAASPAGQPSSTPSPSPRAVSNAAAAAAAKASRVDQRLAEIDARFLKATVVDGQLKDLNFVESQKPAPKDASL